MNLIEKIKAIEIYVCENFEELGLDDPVEEEYFSAYEEIKGASDKELQTFEEDYGVSLPEDWKKLYRYKNGSGFFAVQILAADCKKMVWQADSFVLL